MNSAQWKEKIDSDISALNVSEQVREYLKGYCMGLIHLVTEQQQRKFKNEIEEAKWDRDALYRVIMDMKGIFRNTN